MSTDKGVRARLRRHGAEQIAHPGGNRYAHPCRVSERLAVPGCSREVQAAGPTHAVHGTDGFDLAPLDRASEQVIHDAQRALWP